MLLDRLQDVRRFYTFLFFALCRAASRRSRLREHGRQTHPKRLAFAAELVNQTRNCSSLSGKPTKVRHRGTPSTNATSRRQARFSRWPLSRTLPRTARVPHCTRDCLRHRYGEGRAFSTATLRSRLSAAQTRGYSPCDALQESAA